MNDYDFNENDYDLIVMIFLHLPLELRTSIFSKSILSLKQNGKLLIEAFSKEQINNISGGPRSIDLLYSENDVLSLTNDLRIETMESKAIQLDEGEHHKGKADVIRFVGVKS